MDALLILYLVVFAKSSYRMAQKTYNKTVSKMALEQNNRIS